MLLPATVGRPVTRAVASLLAFCHYHDQDFPQAAQWYFFALFVKVNGLLNAQVRTSVSTVPRESRISAPLRKRAVQVRKIRRRRIHLLFDRFIGIRTAETKTFGQYQISA